MKLSLELYNTRYTIEDDQNGRTADEMKELFSRILVAAGFSPNTLELEDGGRYEYVEEGETVVKTEYLNELKLKEKRQ